MVRWPRYLNARLHPDQHLVVRAVVAALELEDVPLLRAGAREPEGMMGRLEPGRAEPDLVHPVPPTDPLGDLGGARPLVAVDAAVLELAGQRLDELRVG